MSEIERLQQLAGITKNEALVDNSKSPKSHLHEIVSLCIEIADVLSKDKNAQLTEECTQALSMALKCLELVSNNITTPTN